ncbi:MAG: LTA synthase family protein [Bacilli bacterium]|nr:LTA synthase family protein [Bacilli bacterium]
MKKKIYFIIHLIVLFLITIMIAGAIYLRKNFPLTPFEELVFYYKNGVESSDNGVFIGAFLTSLPILIFLNLVFYALLYDITFGKIKLHHKFKNKDIQFYPIKFTNNHRIISTVVLFFIALTMLLYSINFFKYIKYTNSESHFIETNYVNPKDAEIEFKEKRNLIFIVVESLETTFFSKKQGGYWDKSATPELYKLLNDEDSITFYNKNKAQGMKMIQGASWTTASVVANSTGLPFKVPIDGNEYHSKNFMNDAYALGDLLKDNGYYNEAISAATTSFGGLKEYFTKHGKYQIIDVNNLDKFGFKMTDNDYGNWGFNDNYLFKIAKKRLTEISKKDEPFNLELVTIDTHFIDGFIGNYSLNKYKTQYENVYATESKLIYDFISWVKKQDFYKDTTILIVGDHLSMQQDYFTSRNISNRYVYNCIINPIEKTENNSNRVFTALDTYPTIVSAIGGEIKGDKLGLGVNLFSGKKTLAETYKFSFLDEELKKQSEFYNEKILDDEVYFNSQLVESR